MFRFVTASRATWVDGRESLASFAASRTKSKSLAKLRQAAETAGRDPGSIGLAYSAMAHSPKERESADGGRMLMTGSASARQDDVAALAERGVETLIVNVAAGDLNAALDRQAQFAEDVMGKAG